MKVDDLTMDEYRDKIANLVLENFFSYDYKKLCEKDNKMAELKKYKPQLRKMVRSIVVHEALDDNDAYKELIEEYL